MKNIIYIDDSSGPRFDLALDQLEAGLGFVFQGVWIRKEHNALSCETISPKSAESLTEAGASALIEHARAVFERLQTTSARFKSLTEGQPVKFCVIEDYGNGTAVIAELVKDELVWS